MPRRHARGEQHRGVTGAHNVMVVGVEELGHVLGMDALCASGMSEILLQAAEVREPRRGEVEGEGCVEDLIGVGAVEADELNAGGLLRFPCALLHGVCRAHKLLLGNGILPEPAQPTWWSGSGMEKCLVLWSRVPL